jgi:hypothetical protein
MPEQALYEIEGEPVYECPVGAIDREMMNEAFNCFNNYQRGFLPYSGGVYDQPNRLMAMIETVRSARAEHEVKE